MFDVDNFVFEMQQVHYALRPEQTSSFLKLLAHNDYGELRYNPSGTFFVTPDQNILRYNWQRENNLFVPELITNFQETGEAILHETSLADLDVELLLNIYEFSRIHSFSLLTRSAINWRQSEFKVSEILNESGSFYTMKFYSKRVEKLVVIPFTFRPEFFRFRANDVIEKLFIPPSSFDVLVGDAIKNMLQDFVD